MQKIAGTVTVTPNPSAKTVAVAWNGTEIATVKDGANFLRNVDRVLRDAMIARLGFSAGNGCMIADATLYA